MKLSASYSCKHEFIPQVNFIVQFYVRYVDIDIIFISPLCDVHDKCRLNGIDRETMTASIIKLNVDIYQPKLWQVYQFSGLFKHRVRLLVVRESVLGLMMVHEGICLEWRPVVV